MRILLFLPMLFAVVCSQAYLNHVVLENIYKAADDTFMLVVQLLHAGPNVDVDGIIYPDENHPPLQLLQHPVQLKNCTAICGQISASGNIIVLGYSNGALTIWQRPAENLRDGSHWQLRHIVETSHGHAISALKIFDENLIIACAEKGKLIIGNLREGAYNQLVVQVPMCGPCKKILDSTYCSESGIITVFWQFGQTRWLLDLGREGTIGLTQL